MTSFNLTANETRVIGCLMEKSVTTPDQYPLTLNALTNACNQKSGRDPVMALTQGNVQHTVRDLENQNFILMDEGFKRGVEKYTHRFCNTNFSELQFDSAQYAVVCLLLLRGPQTPGELRARSGRLHVFDDNEAVVKALTDLREREGEALVVELPRTPGRKDPEYMHLFSGPVDIEHYESQVQEQQSSRTTERVSMSELVKRVTELETVVAELKQKLDLE